MFVLAQSLLSDPAHNFARHWDDMIAPLFLWTCTAHAVNSFPRPKNPYALWLLASIQFVVGQRVQALETRTNGKPE